MQAPPDEGSAAVERAPTPTKFFKRKQLFVEMDELRGKLSAYTHHEASFFVPFQFLCSSPHFFDKFKAKTILLARQLATFVCTPLKSVPIPSTALLL